MKTRVLPPEEYWRLERTGIPLFPRVRPEDVSVIVVEEEEKVVACMTILRANHFEGAWIDPEHRNAGVTNALLSASSEMARCSGSEWVFAGAADDHMRSILDRLGANKVPMDLYILDLGGGGCPRQS